MKELKILCYLILIMLFLTGCVASIEPFYTEETVINMPELYGKWLKLNEDGTPVIEHPWEFEENEVLTFDDQGREGVLKVTYFKINQNVFIDSYVSHLPEVNEYTEVHLYPLHRVSKVELENNRLTIKHLNLGWFQNYIKENPSSWIVKNESSLVLNASPEDWVKFLEEYGSSEEAFPKDEKMELVFVRQGRQLPTHNGD